MGYPIKNVPFKAHCHNGYSVVQQNPVNSFVIKSLILAVMDHTFAPIIAMGMSLQVLWSMTDMVLVTISPRWIRDATPMPTITPALHITTTTSQMPSITTMSPKIIPMTRKSLPNGLVCLLMSPAKPHLRLTHLTVQIL